jgi:hypothetical protein
VNMKTRKLALLLLLCACDDDDTRNPVDGGAMDAAADAKLDAEADAKLDAEADARVDTSDPRIAASLRKWQQLASEHPGAYWYEEENCAPNMLAGRSTILQVDAQGARVLGTRSFPRTECIAQVNRFGSIDGPAPTFPHLHEVCAALVKRRSDTRFSTDAQGIIETCFVPDAPSCKDNCGSGFALRGWGFGLAAPLDASVPP